MRQLVVYFSREGNNYVSGSIINLVEGNTKRVAHLIQQVTNADIFEIQPLHGYDKDYDICTQEALQEKNKQARPVLLTYVPDFKKYDVIYLGYPNWWGTCPMPIFSFLEQHILKDKVVYPFCTHEGSGLGSSIQDIQKVCPDANIQEGLAILGSKVVVSNKEVKRWLQNVSI